MIVPAVSKIPAPMKKERLRETYDRFAPKYDWGEALPEVLGLRRLRRRLLACARGEVLEVATGTGKNLRYYPPACRIIAMDLSPRMLALARRRAARFGVQATFLVQDAEALSFPDNSFDTVVDALSLCTFPDPIGALHEMARVCRPGGSILLLEHGRSEKERIGRWQDRRAAKHARRAGCRWNLEPHELVCQAGLRLADHQRFFFGVFHLMQVAPPQLAA
ncbi:MAG: class I SAM-dependent methyltransferase [Terriglobia bacterium]